MASPAVASTTASATDTSKRKLPAGSPDAIHPAKRPAGGNPRVRILHVHFSDGIEQLQSGSNGPSAEALNEANGAPSYMRPIARLEKKEVDWLRILAEGLINSSEDSSLKKDLKDGTKQFFLSQLPHGYRLFEQIRHAVGLPHVCARARARVLAYGGSFTSREPLAGRGGKTRICTAIPRGRTSGTARLGISLST